MIWGRLFIFIHLIFFIGILLSNFELISLLKTKLGEYIKVTSLRCTCSIHSVNVSLSLALILSSDWSYACCSQIKCILICNCALVFTDASFIKKKKKDFRVNSAKHLENLQLVFPFSPVSSNFYFVIQRIQHI